MCVFSSRRNIIFMLDFIHTLKNLEADGLMLKGILWGIKDFMHSLCFPELHGFPFLMFQKHFSITDFCWFNMQRRESHNILVYFKLGTI